MAPGPRRSFLSLDSITKGSPARPQHLITPNAEKPKILRYVAGHLIFPPSFGLPGMDYILIEIMVLST